MAVQTEWTVEKLHATVAELHGLGVPQGPRRLIRVCHPTDSAIVLGSAQPESDLNHQTVSRRNLSVVRRLSGGGAVLVEPWDLLWVDVVLPKNDPLWSEDVGKAFHWLGQAWSRTLENLGVAGVSVHEGAMLSTVWSRKLCFAGLGPGECLVGGKKAVGISQRRTREGALFQSSVLLSFDATRLVELFALDEDERIAASAALSDFVTPVHAGADHLTVEFTKTLQNMTV